MHHRLTAYEIQPDSFKVDWETSTDAGARWAPEIKYTYTRASSPQK